MNRAIFYVIAAFCMCVFASCGGGSGSTTTAAAEVDIAEQLWGELDLAAAPNTLAAKERQAGWQLLFNGTSFAGWHGFNTPGEVPDFWAIEDACISPNSTGGGEGQDLATDAIYSNFAFSVEYKLSPGSNSGIIYHLQEGPAYTYAYETGPEFQLTDQSDRPVERRLTGYQSHGANYGMYAPTADPLPFKPAGEWNRLMLICKDNEVIHIVNGVQIVRFMKYSDEWKKLRDDGKWADYPDYGKADEGHISLQNHGAKLWFRNIKLKQL